ncbi:hypothetical protein [Cellulomonas sp.]|uniref:hypothetical protein n=1 Tax=Cellulomonas sp. TaxID=40001 RepID=UPI002D3E14B5|nr:hypothetical protein [Cellulomonas sp.]HYQ76329.1 hypothetical protein [Cellulomonas sp.]
MRLIGWGAIWGAGLFLVPYLAVSALGVLVNPAGAGYLLFSLPVVVVTGVPAGATAGALGGALAAAVAPLARRGATAVPALAGSAAAYFAALTPAVVVGVLLLAPAYARLELAALSPVVTLGATGLATWGLAQERRRAARAAVPVPLPPGW